MRAGADGHKQIAVINDDTEFLNLMHNLLEAKLGWEVLICREWEDAYHFVKDRRPDLVILDIRMNAEERGWSILNLLTLDPATRPIPVIVCSAAIQSLHEHQPLLSRYGIRALPKPFDLDALIAEIDASLAEHGEVELARSRRA